MESKARDEFYSDKYKTTDFHWGISLGEGKHHSNPFWRLLV